MYKIRCDNIENIIKENFSDRIFDILYCYSYTNNILCLSLCLRKEYCNVTDKTKRYVQLNITNDTVELYEEHKIDYRKKFYEEYKEQIEFLCRYIKENKYYENTKIISNNISLHFDFLHFDINIKNQLKINGSYKNIENNNLADIFVYANTKLLKKIKKNKLSTEDILKKVLIKKEEIPLNILEEIELLNRVKVKKKTKNLPKNQ